MKTTTRWTLPLLILLAAAVARGDAQEPVPTNEQIATDLESAAETLHDRADRWSDAATLYVAAADLRRDADARAQKNLFVAANLFVQTGNVGGAIDALESAASRALATGQTDLARERFADAALVAQRHGLSREHQRLSYRTAEVAMAEELARVASARRSP